MDLKTVLKTMSVAILLTGASMGTSHAQFGGYNPIGLIPGGGRINPNGIINQGIGVIQEINRQQQMEERRRQQAIAAQQARQRRAALQRTKGGRAQLAREQRQAAAQARQQQQLFNALIPALFSGGGGGGAALDSRGLPPGCRYGVATRPGQSLC